MLENDRPPSLERVQRRKLAKANWDQFQHLCSTRLQQSAISDADDPMPLVTSILKDIAEETIPKTSAVPKRFNKPWFSDICKGAIKESNRALVKFQRKPTEGNLNAYRIARAKARRDIRHSKKTSWRNYVSEMNSQTSVKSVWNRIYKIKGKDTSNTVNDRDVTSHRDIANALADKFSHNSSSAFSTNKCIVFTDSLSCLQALHHMKLEHPLIGMVIRKCVFFNAKKDIVFCWVPSHTGIKGNEKADSAAKSAFDLPRAKVGVPYNDFKHLISQYIFSTWHDDWNGAVMNNLHSVKPVLGDWQSSYRRCRKDEGVLCSVRIGHTHLTHLYILKKDPPALCEHCQCIRTVRYILVECNHFARERKDIFRRRDVVESFRFHPTLMVLF